MPFFIGEGHNLGFNARAIAGADSLNHAGIDRAAVKIGTDQSMGFFIGIGEITDSLVFRSVNS